jgi:glycosyltransferase involved in cell wall biosynthesis
MFHGQVERSAALEVVRASHCFVSTSATETAYGALLEAMAMGVPSVSTAVGDAPVYLQGPLSENLAPVGDPRAIAEAILRIAREPKVALEKARLRAVDLRQRHDGERVAERLEHYIDVVQRGSWPPPRG